jgi:uncharacterized membrane protein
MTGRILLAAIFLISGCLHFLAPDVYLRIMPPWLPAHRLLVYLSGAAELLGATGLLIPATRHAAAWGLVILLIAVLPANIYMATSHLGAVAARPPADPTYLLGLGLHPPIAT